MKTLYTGKLRKTGEIFSIEMLNKQDVPELVAMQKRIHRQMKNTEWFVEDSEEEISNALSRGGSIFGVFNSSDDLIAARYISIPGKGADNLARDLNYYLNLDDVVHLESTVVEEAYRGNRLQAITLEVARQYVYEQGFTHLLSTVAPLNIYSLYNIMKAGLRIRALKKKYQDKSQGGVWRFILHQDMQQRICGNQESRLIPLEELELQFNMIGNGFIGDQLFPKQRLVVYNR